MSFSHYFKKDVENIVKSNLPYTNVGVWMYEKYVQRLNFFKHGGKLMYQVATKFNIYEKDTDKLLFEFVTATNFEVLKKENDIQFYDMAHLATVSAIAYFNRQIHLNKSTLTIDRRYPEIPAEKTKEAIRATWRLTKFGKPSSN